ncbi:glycosyltransferase [Roseateles koreensis]|uniref:Glycosyltransferase n=1 Tax=Roseateles koreensis TaxID=2987526 RepID=A0ABT5KMG9_9BURK|nr:glycosyltransferase [Roseateles koreensis]MDC8784109.1 glycosyltransferase [Roseateles koreensis]
MTPSYRVSLSIVSHGQGHLIKYLLEDSRSFTGPNFEILLTINIPEDMSFLSDFKDLQITVIENLQPKGFGENHNAAFACSRGELFAIVNPDIRAPKLDLTALTSVAASPKVGACAPRVLSAAGTTEDSARRFPTIPRLLKRVLLRRKSPDYDLSSRSQVPVDWVAGMFVVFPRATYQTVGGFDTRYFMYMEDADICRRLRRRGYEIIVDGSTSVIHDARRASRRNLQHLSWHARSALRFLTGL